MNSGLVVDGVPVHVEGQGDETIIMIHGWPDTYRLWDGTVAALKDRYCCVRFTLPGFDITGPRRAYTLDQLMDFFGKVTDAVSPERPVTLLLHDWGCVFGYQFYTRSPQRVSKIVGVDIGDARSLEPSLSLSDKLAIFTYQFWLALAWAIGGRAGDWMNRWMARRMRCPSDVRAMSSRMCYPYYQIWLGGKNGFRRRLNRFRPQCPMMYIYALRKPVMFHSPDWLEEIRSRPGNRVEAFNTGHWVMIQEPERFHQVVGEWLGK
jgi:cis-3-alkyl-4-acyloxetan-2-one decarboxylase